MIRVYNHYSQRFLLSILVKESKYPGHFLTRNIYKAVQCTSRYSFPVFLRALLKKSVEFFPLVSSLLSSMMRLCIWFITEKSRGNFL